MAASLNTIHQSLKNWLTSLVRVDKWTLDDPSTLVTTISDKSYPANSARFKGAERIRFYRDASGSMCEADFTFHILYRFTGGLPYHALPIFTAEGILNNLYYRALTSWKDIHPAVREITTPDVGLDVVVRPIRQENNDDWVVIIQPAFRVKFSVEMATVGDLQPEFPEAPVYEFQSLNVGIYRGEMGDLQDNHLDRTVTLEAPS